MSDIFLAVPLFATLGLTPFAIGFGIGWAEQFFCAVADLE